MITTSHPIHGALQSGITIANEFFDKVVAIQNRSTNQAEFETERENLFEAALNEIRQLPDADVVCAGFDRYIQRLVDFDDAKGGAK